MGVLFVLAGLCEIGGGYLVWGRLRDHKPFARVAGGAVVLVLYGVIENPNLRQTPIQSVVPRLVGV